MSLIQDAAFAPLRRVIEKALVHSCTITPLVAGAPDAENNVTYTDGTPVTGVPCNYQTDQNVTITEYGRTIVYRSTLLASATGPIIVGMKVTNITGQLGTVLDTGPLIVDRAIDQTAGLGEPLLLSYGLRGADPVGTP